MSTPFGPSNHVVPAPGVSRDRAESRSARRLTRVADLLRVALLCTAAGWLVSGDAAAALRAILVLPPAVLGRLVRIHPAFDLLFSSALAADSIATGLGAYDTIGWNDTLSHLVLPLLSGPILYMTLVRLGAAAAPSAAPTVRFLCGAAVLTAASVLALGALWELVEWTADRAFGTNYSQGYDDTLVDLLADTVAATVAGGLVSVWLWGSCHRPVAASRSGGGLQAEIAVVRVSQKDTA
jgi:hypothetical protein